MNDNNFYSLDRLVEFGLGLGMAQQMVRTMNESMRQMYVPGSIQSMPNSVTPQQVYYVAIDGKPVGPMSDRELSQLITSKKVDKNTLAWMPGMATWQPIEQVSAILKIIALTPPPLNV